LAAITMSRMDNALMACVDSTTCTAHTSTVVAAQHWQSLHVQCSWPRHAVLAAANRR
jgi:hypothetical protein